MPTLAELNEQHAALMKAMAEHELPLFEKAQEALSALASAYSATGLAEIVAELPDSAAKNALANVGAAINAAHGQVSLGLPNIRDRLGVKPTPTPIPMVVPPQDEAA